MLAVVGEIVLAARVLLTAVVVVLLQAVAVARVWALGRLGGRLMLLRLAMMRRRLLMNDARGSRMMLQTRMRRRLVTLWLVLLMLHGEETH